MRLGLRIAIGGLPPSLAGKRYYHPTDRGMEKRIGERLEEVRKAREAARDR